MSAPVLPADAFAHGDGNTEKHELKEQNEDTKDKEDDETEEVDAEDPDAEQEEAQVHESFVELSNYRKSFQIYVRGKIISLTNSPDVKWRLGSVFTERFIDEDFIPEVSAMCVAIQEEGPDPGSKAMMRIRKQLVACFAAAS